MTRKFGNHPVQEDMKKRIECRISGRVQMVMYRDFVTRNAKKFGITGEVWNEKDGTVVAIAEGEESQLKHLILLMNDGPILARVDAVVIAWSEATNGYSKFSIRFT